MNEGAAYGPDHLRPAPGHRGLVAALWVSGQTADWFPDHSLANTGLWSVHVVGGFALAVVLGWLGAGQVAAIFLTL